MLHIEPHNWLQTVLILLAGDSVVSSPFYVSCHHFHSKYLFE
jgi:hypothetical protein